MQVTARIFCTAAALPIVTLLASCTQTSTPGAPTGEAVRPVVFASSLRCGSRVLQLGIGKRDGRDGPQLVVGDRRIDLREVVSASGARYEAIDDPRTSVWVKGNRATVVLAGETLPECDVHAAVAGPAAPTLRAQGNEPSWSLALGTTLHFRTGDTTVETAAPAAQIRDGVRRHEGVVQGRAISVAIREQRCVDTMSGMNHPLSVEVSFDGRTYRGCGGSPGELLTGGEWVVEDIGGGGIIDRSRATLNFRDDGRLAGRASCNSYAGTYALTGESLTIGKAATTMMACAPSLMAQEQRFLEILQQVQRFEISATGALVLIDRTGRTITARRG
jgi:heat shock protein HslJ